MPAPKDPEKYKLWKERLTLAHTGLKRTPDQCKNISKALTGRTFSQSHCDSISRSKKGSKQKPRAKQQCENISKALSGKPKSDIHKKHLSDSKNNMTEEEHKLWRKRISTSKRGKGLVHGNSREKYCYIFKGKDGVRIRSLMFYKFACVECGKTQEQNRLETKCRTQPNGKTLSVHHVYYRKMGCCENEEEYESGVRKVGNTLYIREYDGTENVHVIQGTQEKFVALCSSCHNRSNRVNRAYWIKYYEDLVNTKYGGKCYLTKEEMAAYQPLQKVLNGVSGQTTLVLL